MSSEYPRLEEAWVWPESVERLFREQMEGRTLHVCCGTSDLGDVTVDADPDRSPDVVADMNALPFDECSFDTVIADPPWHHIQAVGQKHGLFYHLLRCVKPNGVLIWNALTIPSSDQTELEQTWVRQDFEEGKISAIAKYRRHPNQTTLDGVAVAADGSAETSPSTEAEQEQPAGNDGSSNDPETDD